MKEADAIVGLYERHAKAFDRIRGKEGLERSWLDRFTALMPPAAHVLDLGCGSGEPMAADLIARGCRVTGVDASETLIGLCRQRFPDHRWLVGDMRELSLAERFDGILAWHSFFHLTPDAQRTMFARFADHAADAAALMFTSGPSDAIAIGRFEGEPLYHASLAPSEYRDLLQVHGFVLVDHVAEDQTCGGATVWLARKA